MSDDFTSGDAGASDTYPQQCSALRKNGHVMIKGHPCKIVDMSTSKTGKHGHAKVHITALDIFDGKKYEDICPSTHNMNVPNVNRCEMECVDMDEDGYVSLMDDGGDIRDDIKIVDDTMRKDVRTLLDGNDGCLVTVLKACGTEKIITCKTSKAK